MRIGVPREIKVHEYRVGLTPDSVREFVAHGHAVLVESNAGAGIGCADDRYRAAGGRGILLGGVPGVAPARSSSSAAAWSARMQS